MKNARIYSRDIAINIALAMVWLFFVYQNLAAFFERPRLTLLLFVLSQTEFLVFLLIRKPPVAPPERSFKMFIAYAVAIVGTFIPLFFQPSDALMIIGATYTTANYVGDMLIYLAVLFEIAAYFSLNTSTGIAPANRGVKTGGLYKYVRHPIYASYLLLYAGYVINNPSSYNMVVLLLALVLQIIRIRNEEAVLTRDAAYKTYAERVKYRLVPGFF